MYLPRSRYSSQARDDYLPRALRLLDAVGHAPSSHIGMESKIMLPNPSLKRNLTQYRNLNNIPFQPARTPRRSTWNTQPLESIPSGSNAAGPHDGTRGNQRVLDGGCPESGGCTELAPRENGGEPAVLGLTAGNVTRANSQVSILTPHYRLREGSCSGHGQSASISIRHRSLPQGPNRAARYATGRRPTVRCRT